MLRFFLFLPFLLYAEDSNYVLENYRKHEYRIPMRDGDSLFISVYLPRDTTRSYPIMFTRTPYTVAPYGKGYKTALGPSDIMMKEKYIFVYQDVRGHFMSDGEYLDVRPNIPVKKSKSDVDESTDAYDTIEWMIRHLPHNNGSVGMWGISYPGFYAAHALISSHPALKAVSPQAPIGDWFIGDDFHHNGALFLIDAFNFFRSFGKPRPGLITDWLPGFEYDTPDGYRFFLDAGPVASLKQKYFGDTVKFWNDVFAHPTYDEFWKSRTPLRYYSNVRPAVMTVGGWFDAEDLYGTLHTYQSIERENPHAYNILVMGPWFHGGWARSDGSRLGNVDFGQKTSVYYQEQLEAAFFNYYLKGEGSPPSNEAYVFETGSNRWRMYDTWPPANRAVAKFYMHENEKLSFDVPSSKETFDEYLSDPDRPVPYIEQTSNVRGREYMTDDQRFAWRRPDVLSYEMDIRNQDLTIAGPLTANLFIATSGTDADVIVKVIDVFPDSTSDDPANNALVRMGGYQMLVRGEVMRGRFRNSYEHPEPFKPNTVEQVSFQLQDINHTFKNGHKLMIQVQSSWFPLVDRNPQKFVNVYKANQSDFIKSTMRLFHSTAYPSNIEAGILRK